MKWTVEHVVLVSILGLAIYELMTRTSTTIPVTVIPPNEPTRIGPPPALRGDSTVDGLGDVFPGITASDLTSPFNAPYARAVATRFVRPGSAYFATGGRFMYPVHYNRSRRGMGWG